jgi:hypothetical protein
MSGRRDLFEERSGDKDFIERFDRMMDDIEAGRTSADIVGKALGKSRWTILRMMEKRRTQKANSVTYAAVAGWKDIPRIKEWEQWVENQVKNPEKEISRVQRIWRDVWGKKNMMLLNEPDIIATVNWIKDPSKMNDGNRFSYIKSVRYVLRSGIYGRPEWLAKHLGTKGLKMPPKFPPEFLSADSLRQVHPRLMKALEQLINEGKVGGVEGRTFRLATDLKRRIGIRTGDANTEFELWGCRINAGKTSMIVSRPEGRLIHFTVHAKKDEIWEIDRASFPTWLIEEVESYIKEFDIKDGDLLLNGRLKRERALKIIAQCCEVAKMSKLRLHDLRKLYASTGKLSGIPLEEFAEMGVGWKDVETLRKWYVAIKVEDPAKQYAKMDAFLDGQVASA